MAAKAELTHLRRAHPPNHTPNSQRPRAPATAIAAATAYGNTSLCMCRSRAACSGFVATMSGRSERVGGTGLEEHRPVRKLSLGVCMGAQLENKLTAAEGRCKSDQK
jgi:hypothetical protein